MPVLWRLLKLTKPVARWMALATLLGFATVACGIGLMTTSAYIISRAALQPSIADLQLAIVGVRFFGISRGVSRYLERLVSHEATFRILARLRVWFYALLEPLAPARLMQYRSGDLLTRSVADIEMLKNLYLRVLSPPLVALLVAVLAAALLGSFDPRLALILLSAFGLAGLWLPLMTHVLSRGVGSALAGVRAELNAALIDGIQGAADLLAFGQERRHLERVDSLSHSLIHLQGRTASIDGLQEASMGLLMNLATLSVLAVGIVLVNQATVSGVNLAAMVLVVISSFEAVLPLPSSAHYLDLSLASGRRLFGVVDVEPAVQEPLSVVPIPADLSLRVEGLGFSYAEGRAPALAGIHFELPAGGTLALVGPSGSGKSTLVSLLLRFWEYREGKILVGGRELQRFGLEEWRRMIAVVGQRTHLFNGTVRENLLMARPGASDAELFDVVRQAQLDEFIRSTPLGFDTWIGEQGLRLSGGERQRLAIARALLKDAPILILDEPTAHLDALAEQSVSEALKPLRGGRTTLIVSHRLVGLEGADEILVLRAGRIVERGRHDELLDREGLYHSMWRLQTQVLAPYAGA
ncbi:thiol reductant ABC exporter subunit CydC [Chloroflexota bacterium]